MSHTSAFASASHHQLRAWCLLPALSVSSFLSRCARGWEGTTRRHALHRGGHLLSKAWRLASEIDSALRWDSWSFDLAFYRSSTCKEHADKQPTLRWFCLAWGRLSQRSDTRTDSLSSQDWNTLLQISQLSCEAHRYQTCYQEGRSRNGWASSDLYDRHSYWRLPHQVRSYVSPYWLRWKTFQLSLIPSRCCHLLQRHRPSSHRPAAIS